MKVQINKNVLSIICALTFILGGCEGTKEQLGLEKKPPDEFAVVKRAPLSMPPDYVLRPPRPGAPRPQEQETSAQARQALFGAEAMPAEAPQGAGGAEDMLLRQAGALTADPAIRRKIDAETAAMGDYNKPVAQRLLGIGGHGDEPSATVVDPAKEAERLKKNQEEGRPVTEGETPSIEQ
jgi:hypothetical protein